MGLLSVCDEKQEKESCVWFLFPTCIDPADGSGV